MTVRAKFTYTGYSTGLHDVWDRASNKSIGKTEMRTLRFSPVYANNDPDHENSKFWKASPQGSIELGTINPEAWSQFKLGGTYYIDFIPADSPPEVLPTSTP